MRKYGRYSLPPIFTPSLPLILLRDLCASVVSFQIKRLNYIGPIRRGPLSIASIEAS